ncbi:MAG: hypothetical protein WC683_17735 [bacterium]
MSNNSLPQDIRPDWLNVIRRLQSVACQQRGYAIITMSVVVDSNGCPVFWQSPQMIQLEPAEGAAKFMAQVVAGMRDR